MAGISDYLDRQKFVGIADTIEMEQGQPSVEFGFLESVAMGTAGASFSAVAGLLNTGVALGESLGVFQEGEYGFDTYEQLNNTFGQRTAQFYADHKTGLDALGFVAGSLVPGMLAVKALRVAQIAGRIPMPAQVATGLKNADFVLGSKSVEAAKQAVLRSGNILHTPQTYAAMRTGLKQQFLENVAFEVGVLTTMNQSATLNPEGLGYFDAMATQFKEGLPFLGIGVGLGTAIDSARIVGAIKKFETEEMARVGKYSAVALEVLEGLQPGDKLAYVVQESKRRAALLRTSPIAAGDFAAERAVKEGDTIVKTALMRAIGEMNFADEAGRLAMEGIVAKATSDRLEDVGTLVAGLNRIDTIGSAEMESLQRFYQKTAAPSLIVRRSDASVADTSRMLDQYEFKVDELIRDATEIFGESKAPAFVADYLNGKQVRLETLGMSKSILRAHGAAGTGGEAGKGVIVGGTDARGNPFVFVRNDIYAQEASSTATEEYFSANNSIRKIMGLPEISREDYNNIVFFHEIGHVKKNGGTFLRRLDDMLKSGNDRTTLMAGEMLNSMYELRPNAFLTSLSHTLATQHGEVFAEKAIRDIGSRLSKANYKDRQNLLRDLFSDGIVNSNYKPGATVRIGGVDTEFYAVNVGANSANAGYFLDLHELVADTVAALASPATRERFARISPNLAEFFNKHGSVVQSWNDKKAYYNTRTGEIAASMLPGLADVAAGNMKVVRNKAAVSLSVPSLGRTFNFNPEAFKELADVAGDKFVLDRAKRPDYLEYEAQWIMAAKQDIAEFFGTNPLTKEPELTLRHDNLPAIERILTDKGLEVSGKLDALFADGKVSLLNVDTGAKTVMSRDALRDHLLTTKRKFRNALAATGGLNEHEIARILNIENANARGDFMEDGWTLMNKKNMEKPEIVAMSYKPMDMGNVEASVKSQVAVDARNQLLQHNRNMVSSQVLGQMDSLLPEISVEEVAVMSRLSSRATLLTNVRSQFGSVREKMQFVGRLAEKAIQQKVAEVADSFAEYTSRFNRPDMMQARYELAQIDNLIRREWYHKYGNYIIRKSAMQEWADELEVDMTTLRSMLDSEPDMIERMIGAGSDKFAPDAVKLSDEVSKFYDMHKSRNAGIVERKKVIAASKGRNAVLDEDVLYPPPRDLSRSKYVGFVAPKVFAEGADSRKFMIFAESQTEYDAKVAAIRGKYGNQYEIFSRSEVAEYKKYVGEYEEGLVFDEIYFDSEIRRAGTASELLPSVDLQVSGTLSRYQDFHVRQETSLIRSGVEAKYGQVVQYLRQMDEVVGAAERDTLSKKFRSGATIYKDSLGLMLGKRESSGPIEDMWVRLNDYIGQKGSNFIDSVFGVLRADVSNGVTKEALDKFNSTLESQGFKPPFAGVMETVLISPDPEVSRALPSLVRTLNNLAGTMMLRLDMAHSIVQLMSSPILAMPVLLEAKDALKGTARGTQLDNLTSVIHPTTGVKEPTVMKLMMRGVKNFWSADGKQFMQQLRERGIVNDYLRQYQEVMDFSQLNGRHQMKQVNDKIDKLAEFGSKWSGFTVSEEMTRFMVAHAAHEIGTIRGLSGNELWSVVASAVDKVHGIYIGHQRPQLFQGAMGQAIGLYQTYFFNFMQNAMKFVSDGNKKQALAMGALQMSIFGVQSMPGFHTFNQLIGETNRENLDLYNVTNADDPRSLGAYFLYGLGSHALGVPVDFYTRGDLAIRNTTVVPNPLNPMEIPALGMVVRAVGNMYNTVKLATQDNVGAAEALLHGIAHNGMNRPMQGLATILQGRVTSGAGMTYFDNANYVGYQTPDPDKSMIEHALSGEINFAGMFARLIGTRPLNESIIANHYFRQAAYQTSVRQDIEAIGAQMQMSLESGNFDSEAVSDFMLKYERAGGDIQNFNAYMSRQFQNSRDGTMVEFRKEMEKDGAIRRAYNRMLVERSNKAPWEYGSDVMQ